MITPSFALTATERVLPKLALDFTTASLDSRVTFTRSGNTATVINSSGVIVAINADLPRFDFDPSTLVCKGLLIEEARTNALLNSLIDGTDLATQLVTVTAAARTLSFYGTGTVVLSGAHSATVVGTGAYPARTTLTFTPSAGVLTLTVTGTVQFAQLEAGAFATSYIPTAGSSLTRNADVATMTGTNFSSWWNTTEGSIVFDYDIPVNRSFGAVGGIGQGTFNTSARLNVVNALRAGGTSFPNPVTCGTAVLGANKMAIAMKVNDYRSFVNGVSNGTDTTASMFPVATNEFKIGKDDDTDNVYANGWIRKIFYYSQRLTDAELAAFSK